MLGAIHCFLMQAEILQDITLRYYFFYYIKGLVPRNVFELKLVTCTVCPVQ